jgi:transcriptional regulator with XRE-family HTH domain
MEPADEIFFGELLTRLRKRNGVTQQELARQIGVHRSTISF